MKNSVGRPMKYRKYIESLNDNDVHSPASIVIHGIERGLMPPDLVGEALKAERLRIRHTLSCFSHNHQFPNEGDGSFTHP